MYLIVATLTVSVVVGLLVWLEWEKHRRLTAVTRALAELKGSFTSSRSGHQARFEVEASRVRRLDDTAADAETRARSLVIPAPPKARTDTDETVSALAGYLHASAAQISVAGGEQVLTNLIDMSSSETAPHLLHAAHELYQAGFAQFVMDLAEGGLPGAMESILVEGGKVFMAHGTVGVVSAVEELGEHLHDAGHHLGDAFDPLDAGGAHFPFVTLLMSTARERALLLDRKTTLERGLAHIAIDTAGTGVGGLGGAKAGAFLGSLVAPGVGTAIGGILGAIAGAITGRLVANEVKLAPLKDAVAEFQSDLGTANSSLGQSAGQMAAAMTATREDAQRAYLAGLSPTPRVRNERHDPELARIASALSARLLFCTDEVERTLGERLLHLRESIPVPNAWQRAFGLDIRADVAAATKTAREEVGLRLTAQRDLILSLMTEDPMSAAQTLGTTPLIQGGDTPRAFEESHVTMERLANAFEVDVAQWAAETATGYHRAVAMVVRTGAVEANRHSTEVQRWRSHLDAVAAVVHRHKEALGLA